MTVTRNDLKQQLDHLEATVQGLLTQRPDPAEFWPEFAGMADAIEDAIVTDEDADYRAERMAEILAECDIAGMMQPD